MIVSRRLIPISLVVLGAALSAFSNCGTAPRAPVKPTGPATTPRGAVATYSTVTTDRNSPPLPVYYQFDWGDLTSSAQLGPFPSDSAISDTHAFARAGTFDVRARAKNAKSGYSDYGDTLKVTVVAGESTLKWFYQATDPADPEAILPFRAAVSSSSDGSVLAAFSDGGYLHLLTANGTRRGNPYATPDQSEFVNSPSFTADGHILAGDEAAFDEILQSGSPAWTVGGLISGYGPAAIDGAGNIFVNADDGFLHALKSNGSQLWAPVHTGGGRASPVVTADGSLVIVGGDDSLIHAFNILDGTQAWAPIATQGAIQSSPAITSDGKIVIGSDDGILRAVKPDAGGVVWTYAANSPLIASPVIGDGVIYVTSENGVLHAVNPDGTGKWTMPLGCNEPTSGAITISGILYLVGSFAGDDSLIAVNTSSQTRRWGVAVPGSTGGDAECSPMIEPGGAVVVTSSDYDVGGVYAFWGTDGPAQSSWPMYQHDASRTGRASQ